MSGSKNYYSTVYSGFDTDLRATLRAEVYGDDIGQQSWTTATELQGFAIRAGLTAGMHLLEVGCGAGGPALYMARQFGIVVTGVDIDADGIEAARKAADRSGLKANANFYCTDGNGPLPFPDRSFDVIQVIDAINHMPDRLGFLQEMRRLLKPDSGILMFTDPVVITGPISADEIAARSSIGYFVWTAPGVNERLLGEAGFKLVYSEDRTDNISMIAGNWVRARERHRDALIALDGLESVELAQRFGRTVHQLSVSGRMSRFFYVARLSAA